MNILQNVLVPSEMTCNYEELYYHTRSGSIIYDGYFNIFSYKKWLYYTKIHDIQLLLNIQGRGTVEIRSDVGLVTRVRVCETACENDPFRIKIPVREDITLLWFSFSGEEMGSYVKMASFVTEDEPAHDIRLAIAICTFKREPYVKRNLRVLQSAILNNADSPLYGKLDVYIVDNGQTLRETELFSGEMNSIYLIPNKNAGGSGGFTRGMLEVLRQKERKGYTNVILMDDDAVLEPDSFVRCYALLCYLKEKFRESCIAGSMLDLDEPYMQNESGSDYREGQAVPLGAGIDLRDPEQVRINEEKRSCDYAGWWWACFSLNVVREDNLPLPFFIHFDDIEYGLRNDNGIILLNGICIWHPTPHKRLAQSTIYYNVRNRLVTEAMRSERISVRKELKGCLNEMFFNLLRYQYSVSELVALAVEDVLCGPVRFGRIDPVRKNEQVRNITDQPQPVEQLTDREELQEKIRKYMKDTLDPSYKRKGAKRWNYILTLNGWLLPAGKQKQNEVVFCDLFRPDMRELFRAKEGLLIDPYAEKGIWVEKDYRKALHCMKLMLRVSFQMLLRYRMCAAIYRTRGRFLTEKKFWKKYLGY